MVPEEGDQELGKTRRANEVQSANELVVTGAERQVKQARNTVRVRSELVGGHDCVGDCCVHLVGLRCVRFQIFSTGIWRHCQTRYFASP